MLICFVSESGVDASDQFGAVETEDAEDSTDT